MFQEKPAEVSWFLFAGSNLLIISCTFEVEDYSSDLYERDCVLGSWHNLTLKKFCVILEKLTFSILSSEKEAHYIARYPRQK